MIYMIYLVYSPSFPLLERPGAVIGHQREDPPRGPRARRAACAPLLRALAAGLCLTSASAARALTIDDFVREVVDANPLVREQLHAYRQVAQDERIALAGWRPRLDLSASAGQFSRKAPNTLQRRRDFDSQQADITLTQNLFDGFDTTNQVEQARARLSSAAFQLYDTADNVALDAVQGYLNALSEQRLVELAAQNVQSHQRILDKIRELSESGIVRRSDLEQTEGRLAQAQAALIAQQNNLEDAVTQLHTLAGLYVAPEALVEPTPLGELAETRFDPLLEEALRAHPAIQSARDNIRAARFDYRRAKSADLPTLDLSVRQSVGNEIDGARGRTDEGSVVLSLGYNLYRGGADAAEQRKRASAMHESKAFLDRVRRQVIDTLRLALAAERSLHAQLPYLARHARKSLETVELYREEYLLQKRDLIDLLDAEGELTRALSSQAQAHYDAMASRYRVYEGLGALFGVLRLAVDVEDNDLRIADLRAAGIDDESLPADRDADGVPDDTDLCDNSPSGAAVDAAGCAGRAEVGLGMDAVNLTFEAVDDGFTTPAGQALIIAVDTLLDNDRVPQRDQPELRAFSQPEHGSVTVNDDGDLVYTPPAAFVGRDAFQYTLGDARGRRATATVQVDVEARGGPPLDDVVQLQFEYKQLTFQPGSQARFEQVLDTLAARPALRVEITAHTDNVGSAAYNERLSGYRADAVRAMLEARGVHPSRITARGKGEREPIADNATETGRARNRRVEIRFLEPGER